MFFLLKKKLQVKKTKRSVCVKVQRRSLGEVLRQRPWGWGPVTPLCVDTTRVSYLISRNPIEGYGFLLREAQRVKINSLQDY